MVRGVFVLLFSHVISYFVIFSNLVNIVNLKLVAVFSCFLSIFQATPDT